MNLTGELARIRMTLIMYAHLLFKRAHLLSSRHYFRIPQKQSPKLKKCQTTSQTNKNFAHFDQLLVVEVNGIEPMTSCVQGRRSPS